MEFMNNNVITVISQIELPLSIEDSDAIVYFGENPKLIFY